MTIKYKIESRLVSIADLAPYGAGCEPLVDSFGLVAADPASTKHENRLAAVRWCEGEDLNLHGSYPASTSS